MGKPGGSKGGGNSGPGVTDAVYYNILFLGSTGVGKSTFINAFVNYLSYESLDKAKDGQALVMIPSKFVITDENLKERVISVSCEHKVANESEILTDSATQETKIYTFPLLGQKNFLRLIDTPGIGDTRGIDKDEENCEDILRKIEQYTELHAICILLHPNNARLTAWFEFIIKQLLSRLDKSASQNMIFIFTNSRATFYKPGDTLPVLQRVLEDIKNRPPHVDVPLNNKNVFCMDNEAFRFLMAMKEVKFKKDEVAQFERSWEKSRSVCLR